LKKNISISILNVENIESFLNRCKESNEMLNKNTNLKDNLFDLLVHFDVMDNKFVPNDGIELEKIKIVKKLGFYIDTHLMVEKPIEDKYIDKAIDYGSDCITIHIEIENFNETFEYLIKQKLDKKISIGISIKPDTNIEELDQYMDRVDKVLFMTVNPGFGGQKYIDGVNDKILKFKEKYPNVSVQIDGGVNFDTISIPLRNKVDSFVVGSYLTKNEEELYDRLCILNAVKSIEELPKDGNIEFDAKICNVVKGGYGEGDILLGIKSPNMRSIAKKWKKTLDIKNVIPFLTSNYHDYRRFAIFTLVEKINLDNKDEIKNVIDNHLENINNWDLVDTLVPKCIGEPLLKETDEKIYNILREYTISDYLWKKRIGIVSLLYIAKAGRKEIVLKVIEDNIYDDFHLHQKASGWVLRELYKKCPEDTLKYLVEKNNKKKLPSILKSYACEKMSLEEKQKLK